MVCKEVKQKMCLVQIIFFVVWLKQKCLGLHQMYVNNGFEDNIEIYEILVEGLGWEVYVLGCLHTINWMKEPHVGEQQKSYI